VNHQFTLSCVLFDLDGTLLDTAPDLTSALNYTLMKFGFPTTSVHYITPYISYGAAVMIEQALTEPVDKALKTEILSNLLNYYEQHIADLTKPFPGIMALLETLESKKLPWGIVTNKRERMALPLMKALNLTERAACIICGDTSAHSKPHPEPMLTASRQIGVAAAECLYIGDAAHDMTAGQAANMKTLAATYGYLKPNDKPQDWGADALITHPTEILDWITRYAS